MTSGPKLYFRKLFLQSCRHFVSGILRVCENGRLTDRHVSWLGVKGWKLCVCQRQTDTCWPRIRSATRLEAVIWQRGRKCSSRQTYIPSSHSLICERLTPQNLQKFRVLIKICQAWYTWTSILQGLILQRPPRCKLVRYQILPAFWEHWKGHWKRLLILQQWWICLLFLRQEGLRNVETDGSGGQQGAGEYVKPECWWLQKRLLEYTRLDTP